jgi:hypothetical protein
MSLGLIDGAAILLELCGNSMAGHEGEDRVMGSVSWGEMEVSSPNPA